jgi:recombination protein RecR
MFCGGRGSKQKGVTAERPNFTQPMSEKFKKIIEYFSRLPGIGPRQAARLAMALIDWSTKDLEEFSDSINGMKDGPTLCKECFYFTDENKCRICSNTRRDKTKIAVVEKITDLESMEKTRTFDGVYHVLGGVVDPASGFLPEKLKIRELVARVSELKKLTPQIEVILATNPNVHGETTAMYIEEELRPLAVKITRLARGLAAGSNIEYVDEITLANALKNRR